MLITFDPAMPLLFTVSYPDIFSTSTSLYVAMEVEKCFASFLCLLLALLPSQRDSLPTDLDAILRGLLREERFREVNGRNRVAIGFGSCEDVKVADGLAFLQAAGIEVPESPLHHDVISSPKHLAETFAYFYEYGAAAE